MEENKKKTIIALSENKFLNSTYYDSYKDYRKGNGVYLWGSDNLMPNKILELKHKSPTHNALIDLKQFMLNQWEILGNEQEKEIFNRYNKIELNDLVRMVIRDYVIFGQFAVKIMPTESGYKFLEYVPIQNIRMSSDLDSNCDYSGAMISKDWSNLRFKENKKYYLPLYKKGEDPTENVLYLFRTDWDSTYQTPDYFAAINSIILEEEISKFNLANTKNGWAPRLMITTFGQIEQTELQRMAEIIDEAYSGSHNAGRVVYLHAANKDEKAEIESINYNLNDSSYVNLVVSTKDYILSAHKCTSPALAGLAINGGFEGQGSALLSAYNLYDQLCISQLRMNIQTELNKLFKICNFELEINMSLKELKIEPEL